MLKTIKGLFAKLDEVYFTILTAVIAIILVMLGMYTGDPNIQELSNRGVKVSVFLMTSVGLIKYFRTKAFDVWREIIEEHNVAFAIVIAAMIIGIAACLVI